MRKLAALIVVLCLALPALAARKKTTRKASTTAKKSAVSKKSTSKKTTTAKKSTKRPVSKTKATARRRPPARRPSWRAGQMTPTPERYKEIQQALIDKGYLASPATGTWGTESTEALRKFQQAQNLDPNGKLDSLTLISLGLGPKREAPVEPKTAPAPRGQQ